MSNDALVTLLKDERLRSLIQVYVCAASPSVETAEAGGNAILAKLEHQVGQLCASRFVVPVAGIQGSGKSTLLNALAFDEPVLPIDADETTCVPVEIGWSASPKAQAVVHYADGRVSTLPCTEDALRSVVHNENNPGNVHGIACVVLESNKEFFRHGLVLVDLPGTGSLTAANMETTQRYLREAIGVIFMLRTVPPLTRSEAMFVQLQWASLRSAIFVQNQWNDETKAEAEQGRDHNVKTLIKIAEQAHIPLVEDPLVHSINGFKALHAALTQDPTEADRSGLTALRSSLAQFGQGWGKRVRLDIVRSLAADFAHLVSVIDSRLDLSTLDRTQHLNRMVDDERRFADHLADVDKLANTLRQNSEKFRHQTRKQLRSWIDDKSGEMRNLMRTKMRAGIVDGARLDRALQDEQSIASEDIFAEVQEDALTLQDQLKTTIAGLEAWDSTAPATRFTVGKDESSKWENVASRAGSATVAVGGAWAGAEYGVLLGLPAGPIGVAIGGAIGGLIGGLAGMWMGNKTRQGINHLRIKAVEDEVFGAIDRFLRCTADTLNDAIDSFCLDIGTQLDQWRGAEMAKFEGQRQHSREQLSQTKEEKEKMVQILKDDRQSLDDLLAKLNEVRE